MSRVRNDGSGAAPRGKRWLRSGVSRVSKPRSPPTHPAPLADSEAWYPRSMRLLCSVCLLLMFLTSCGIPTDPRDTLENVRSSGELAVGVSASPPWTLVDGDSVSGSEVELVEGFAEHLGVRTRWVIGGEQHLVDQLEKGELQIVIGGITADTPWSRKAAPTRAYAESTAPDGKKLKHVMLVRLGENRFLGELERYLDVRTGKLR